MLRNLQRLQNVLMGQLALITTSHQPRNLDNVLDLATVHIHARQLHQPLGSNRVLLNTGVEEVIPDRLAALNGKILVSERDVNARLGCRVEYLDTVDGEENCAFAVLEDAEEDGDELIALEVVEGASREEDVGLVEKENGVSAAAELKDILELGLDFGGVKIEIVGGHDCGEYASKSIEEGNAGYVGELPYNGSFISSATDSAVSVFPTTGGPQSKMIMPQPFPWITLSNISRCLRRD